jgi:chorismate mutase/prephenate dehydratase
VQFFGSSIQHIPCSSFDEVFHAATAGSAEFGVVAVENSTEGVVTRSLDLLLHSPLHIVGEISLLVRHNLLRSATAIDGIEVVLAHPQALAQCQGWLNTHLPHAERRAASSNAEGARLAATNPAWAGIASERAGRRIWPACGLPRDSGRRLQPHPFCGSLPAQHHAAPQATGRDCTSLVVSVPNRPGAVHDMLVPLKKHGVSMTRFRIASGALWAVGVLFLHRHARAIRRSRQSPQALLDLQGLCAFYKVLGTYPLAD